MSVPKHPVKIVERETNDRVRAEQEHGRRRLVLEPHRLRADHAGAAGAGRLPPRRHPSRPAGHPSRDRAALQAVELRVAADAVRESLAEVASAAWQHRLRLPADEHESHAVGPA